MSGTCCSPGGPTARPSSDPVLPSARGQDHGTRLVPLRGGSFRMGSEDGDTVPGDAEGPVREVSVRDFGIDAVCVSNHRFEAFTSATGYRTDAERAGWSYVFEGLLPAALRDHDRVAEAPWWVAVPGADWRSPEGPGSSIAERAEHPVVHVSCRDALAYCAWAGLRLPTEAEWEYAARGGLEQARFPWGDDLTPGGVHRCNIWQGSFPGENTGEDGWLGTAPVDAFEPNGFGLFNTSGNVWEWTADPWQAAGAPLAGTRVIRGGSYLCHASYCNRYRVSARTVGSLDSTAGHQGFRVAL